jgi:hypothetical protein
MLGAALIPVGVGLAYLPAGVVAAGVVFLVASYVVAYLSAGSEVT